MAPAKKTWSDAETTLLISFYGDYFGALEKMAKKKPIYERISQKLKEHGYLRDPGQVSKKISNLREDYKKKKPGSTGDERPSWIHFEALHKILHERPALNSDAAVTSEIGLSSDNDNVEEEANGQNESEQGNPEENMENADPIPSDNQSTGTREEPMRKKSRYSDKAMTICSETLNFMKSQAAKRDVEREELKTTNSRLVSALDRIAGASESIAESMKNGNVAIIHSENLE